MRNLMDITQLLVKGGPLTRGSAKSSMVSNDIFLHLILIYLLMYSKF